MVNPQAEFNMKVWQPVIDSDNKRIAETLQPAADTANKTLATASLIHDLLPTVSTGWGADARQQGAKILSAMGVSDQDLQNGILKVNPANGDAIRKLFLQQSADAVRAMRKSRLFLRKANCGTERGQPKRVVFYVVPMVRIQLPPAGSLVRTSLP